MADPTPTTAECAEFRVLVTSGLEALGEEIKKRKGEGWGLSGVDRKGRYHIVSMVRDLAKPAPKPKAKPKTKTKAKSKSKSKPKAKSE
tara:strand:- start:156 stop:419 length:264 start_codon:yes stop_codon:yes gene_type:complete